MKLAKKHKLIQLSVKFKFLLSPICILLFSFSILGQDGYELNKVHFEGNKTFKKSELMPILTAYELSFIQRLTKRKEPYFYNQEFIDNDLERLLRFYQSEGFIYVQGTVDTLNTDNEKRKVDVIIKLREGKPMLVDSISFLLKNNSNISFRDSLSNRFIKRFERRAALKTNNRFRDAALSEDVIRINRVFQNRGFAYSKTNFELNIDTAENKTDIFFSTDAGVRSKFGATNITGQKHIKDRLLYRQLSYAEGDRYSSQKLDVVRRNLYDLQLFRIISVVPRFDPDKPDKSIPIDITVEEMPRISTEFGLGFGTEDLFRAFADITYRGLFNDATRLNVYLKHSALEPYHVSLKLIQPQFLDKKTSIMINPYLRRKIEPGFDTQTLGLNLPLNRKFSDWFNMAMTYYYEKVTQHKESGDVESPNPESRKYLYNKSGLQLSTTYSNAQPRFSPEKGVSASLNVKYNGYFFPGDFDYTRLWVDLRNYHKLGGFSLALRGMIGGIHSPDSTGFIPVEDRFYSGGSNSIRGWGRSQLGPKRDSGSPLGGKSILEMSVELRHRLFWQLDGAVFVDAGNVWKESYHFKMNDLAYSAGIGFRYKTPIGPIRFDVSMPIANEKKTPQFFLSVGQAF